MGNETTYDAVMPGLTVEISPTRQTADPELHSSRSVSPVQPPYSPITPTLAAARLATASGDAPNNIPASQPQPPRPVYTHSQPAQTAIPLPPPVPISFDENPDALALKSAISILQIQARNATRDIQALSRIKARAVEDPEGFQTAILKGDIISEKDGLYHPKSSAIESDDEDEDEGDDAGADLMDTDAHGSTGSTRKWEKVPTPQNVVRCPPINWNQYAIVGDSLDKMHRDQQVRPADGVPQRLGADGQLQSGGEGIRRTVDVGVAAPYSPAVDKIAKAGAKKNGKR